MRSRWISHSLLLLFFFILLFSFAYATELLETRRELRSIERSLVEDKEGMKQELTKLRKQVESEKQRNDVVEKVIFSVPLFFFFFP
jgi:cell division protein FtsL